MKLWIWVVVVADGCRKADRWNFPTRTGQRSFARDMRASGYKEVKQRRLCARCLKGNPLSMHGTAWHDINCADR